MARRAKEATVWERAKGGAARARNRWRRQRMRGPGKINFLARRDNLHTIEWFRSDWAPSLLEDMRIFTYEDLPRADRLPSGLWVFADVDRLSVNYQRAVDAWTTLESTYGREVRLLNRPGVSRTRKELLEELKAAGINRFTVHAFRDWRRVTAFPVFIRHSTDHAGTLTPLLDDCAALRQAVGVLERETPDTDDLLIVEYLDTSHEGLYRKYSAFRLGDTILAHHIFHSRHWHVKAATLDRSAALIGEEQRFREDNPHRDQLEEIYRVARIEFGRIDYGMLDGRIQVWEINTNPTILARRASYSQDQMPAKMEFAAAVAAALRAMARATL